MDTKTNVEHNGGGLPTIGPVEPECQHNWLCGKCTRCGKVPFDKREGHKLEVCKCTVCGREVHDWELVSTYQLRENFQCSACDKKYTKVYQDDNDYIGTIKYVDEF